MARRLLVAWLVLLLLTGYTAVPFPDPLRLGGIPAVMIDGRVRVTTHWEECGALNAFYSPAKRSITLCTELLAAPPGFVRYVYAHELAHAVIIQLDIPFTGSHEAAADELAAVMFGLYGMADDIDEAGRYWMARGQDNPPWSDHPDDDWRGLRLRCLAYGAVSKNRDHECTEMFLRASSSWLRLLGYTK